MDSLDVPIKGGVCQVAAGHWACTFSAPQTLFFKSQFLQTKQLRVLSQLKYKSKDPSEFSKHNTKRKGCFLTFKKERWILLVFKYSPAEFSYNFPLSAILWLRPGTKIFSCERIFFFFQERKRHRWKNMSERAKQEGAPNHGSAWCQGRQQMNCSDLPSQCHFWIRMIILAEISQTSLR